MGQRKWKRVLKRRLRIRGQSVLSFFVSMSRISRGVYVRRRLETEDESRRRWGVRSLRQSIAIGSKRLTIGDVVQAEVASQRFELFFLEVPDTDIVFAKASRHERRVFGE